MSPVHNMCSRAATGGTKILTSAWWAGLFPTLAIAAVLLLAVDVWASETSMCSGKGKAGVVQIDDCLLHPWGPPSNQVVGGQCPSRPPSLTVSADYRCQECGGFKPVSSLSVTGIGDCEGTFQCYPALISVNYYETAVQIWIQERLAGQDFCVNDTVVGSGELCTCPSCQPSPIIISLDNGSLQLTSAQDGVLFDLTADGVRAQTAWTQGEADDAFLVLDRNENGTIDNGSELFGDATPQPIRDPSQRNGFEALAVFDDSLSGGNEDGFLDENDAIFGELQLWIDTNHNGISEVEELQSMSDAGVHSFDLSYRSSSRVDAHGNELRFYSSVLMTRGRRIAWDVFFVQQ